MRPDRDTYWFHMASVVAMRATCPRASIGAVLVKFDRQIGAGFNGAPEGEPHCPETAEHMAIAHCERARHAEVNALRNALLPPFGATLYVVGPRPVCVNCTDRLREAGVTTIKWRKAVLTLDSIIREVNEWQAVTFPRATPASVVEHLRREVNELIADPTNTSELADVIFLAVGLAYELDIDIDGLARIVADKLAVNRARQWQAPDAQGVVEHVR